MELERLCDNIYEELEKIEKNGISRENLDHLFKLTAAKYFMDTMEYHKAKAEMFAQGGYSSADRNRNRDSRGRYSRGEGYSYHDPDGNSLDGGYSRHGEEDDPYRRYVSNKRSYRYSRSDGNKRRVMESLEDYMNDMTSRIEDMARDADTQEERDTIMSYAKRMQNIISTAK